MFRDAEPSQVQTDFQTEAVGAQEDRTGGKVGKK